MFSLPICPHCKEIALYTEAFLAKNRKKYRCKNCGEIVSVMIKESVFKFLWIIQLFAIFIFMASILFTGSVCLLGIIAIIFIFMIFYIFSPFFVTFSNSSSKKSGFARRNVKRRLQKKEFGRDTEKEIYSN